MRSVLDFLDLDPAFNIIFGQETVPTVTDEEVVVEFDVPGFEADDLALEIDSAPRGHSILLLSGEKRTQSGVRKANQTVTIPEDVNEETSSARLANGVLTVTLERSVQRTRRKVPISS